MQGASNIRHEIHSIIKMRGVFLFFFLFCAIALAESTKVKKHCCHGPHEIWKCKGCDACCMNPKKCCKPHGPPGCYCEDGYVRDEFGNCIKACDCPHCRRNEVYRCGSCDGTCKNPDRKCCCPCKPGCFCRPGYVRNIFGMCILKQHCFHK